MKANLYSLMTSGVLPPLSYYFSRFVSKKLNVDENSLLAQTAALISSRNVQGDICVDLKVYANKPMFDVRGDVEFISPYAPDLTKWIDELKQYSWIGQPGSVNPFVMDGHYLYLGKYWHYEQQVLNALSARLNLIDNVDYGVLKEGLNRLFGDNTTDTVDWQKLAAAIAVTRQFTVISGGPGTGKTTTVTKVLTLLLEQNNHMSIALVAPTGKAAARLSDSIRSLKNKINTSAEIQSRIPDEAMTIHRLLGSTRSGEFRHNSDNPLVIDCIVIDEASMIDLPLMAHLLESLPQQTRIILLGDRDQLASVEAGNVLGDITGHGQVINYRQEQADLLVSLDVVKTTDLIIDESNVKINNAIAELKHSYRFDDNSGIGQLSAYVNAGEGKAAHELFNNRTFSDIHWLDTQVTESGYRHLNEKCIEWAIERYLKYFEQDDIESALTVFDQYRVLATSHHGAYGVNFINDAISERLFQQGVIHISGVEDYPGKPIMVTRNDYEIGLYNGDTGLLWLDEHKHLCAYFRQNNQTVRRIPLRQLPAYVTAYALTVHKSQGSEFDEVMLILPDEVNPVLSRELIYTGITRAKKLLTVQGNSSVFVRSCGKTVERSSGLARKLGWI